MHSYERHLFISTLNSKRYVFPTEDVFKQTLKKLGCSEASVTSEWRTAEVLHDRYLMILMLSVFTDLSLSAIGRRVNRDHTTVIYSMRKIRALMEDSRFSAKALQVASYVIGMNVMGAPPTALIPPVKPTGRVFDDDYRETHEATVGYARALYAAHGENAKYP